MINSILNSPSPAKAHQWTSPKWIATNLVAAISCTALAFVYFAVAFTAGEFRTEPPGTNAALIVVVLAAAATGGVVTVMTKSVPWLGHAAAPILSALPFGRDDLLFGMQIGGASALVFLFGSALTGLTRVWFVRSWRARRDLH